MVAASSASACSSITTLSAPGGNIPPVAMRAVWPAAMENPGDSPMAMEPTTWKKAGLASAAPKVEAA